jgi:hypothetical protein
VLQQAIETAGASPDMVNVLECKCLLLLASNGLPTVVADGGVLRRP